MRAALERAAEKAAAVAAAAGEISYLTIYFLASGLQYLNFFFAGKVTAAAATAAGNSVANSVSNYLNNEQGESISLHPAAIHPRQLGARAPLRCAPADASKKDASQPGAGEEGAPIQLKVHPVGSPPHSSPRA